MKSKNDMIMGFGTKGADHFGNVTDEKSLAFPAESLYYKHNLRDMFFEVHASPQGYSSWRTRIKTNLRRVT